MLQMAIVAARNFEEVFTPGHVAIKVGKVMFLVSRYGIDWHGIVSSRFEERVAEERLA